MQKLLLVAAVCGNCFTPVPPSPDVERAPMTLADTLLSPRCQTPVVVCLVAPQPVGSPCVCGTIGGTIIPP